MRYTITELKYSDECSSELADFFRMTAYRVARLYGNKFNWGNFQLCKNHRLTVCFRDGKPVGLMLARLYPSVFDPKITVLFQDLLYARPGTRAAKLLMDDFIDFGKLNANHIITTIGEKTNVKARSLEKLGFKKLEVKYRLEV